MYQWSEEQLMVRDAVRRFVEEEIKPNLEELEHGDTPPYDVLRKMIRTFGIDVMARDRVKRRIDAEKSGDPTPERDGGGMGSAMAVIPIIELCR